jgi:hypothetical protein
MPLDRSSLKALRNLIADTDLILETTPDLPQNCTACSRENLRAALALVGDLIGQQRVKPHRETFPAVRALFVSAEFGGWGVSGVPNADRPGRPRAGQSTFGRKGGSACLSSR